MSRRLSRGARASLVVVAVALAAAAIVAGLGFRSSDAFPGGVPDAGARITVSDTATGRPVAPGFVGLSLEFTTVEDYAGTDPNAINPVLVRLIGNLAPHQRPVLRIGGDSSDWGWVPVPGLRHSRGIRYSLGQRWVSVMRALAAATDARLILGLNLEANSPQLMAAQVSAFQGVGQRALTAFELGNEPELFGSIPWYVHDGHRVFGRRHGYAPRDYVREFTRFSKLVPASIPLAGPATGGPRWIPKIANFLAAEPRAHLATVHLYPLHRCYVNQNGPTGPSIPNLLSPPASAGLAAGIARYVAPVHGLGATLRVGEMNSVSCSGAKGVSDTFASALWALDVLFNFAREGVDGVNFHTLVKSYYHPFSFSYTNGHWSANVAPMYYGMLAFAQAAPAGSRLLSVSEPSDPKLRVWATKAPDGHVRVVLINTSPERSPLVDLKLPGGGNGPPTIQRLIAPSLAAKSEVTLGGQEFAENTTTGRLTGAAAAVHPRRTTTGGYRFRLPAGSATILSR